jgi:cyclophilin family peptidyl-prolyl cis-trans isomerase/HEAT repeat protein
MSASCLLPFRIPCACRAALLLAGMALCRPVAAQQPDEGLIGELARLLAAADARTLDASLLGTALRSQNPGVRRQAALAAGRIGDAGAVPLLLPALSDSDAVVEANAAFSLGLLKSTSAVPALVELIRSVPPAAQDGPQVEAATALARIGGAEASLALREILGNGSTPGVATPAATSAALVAAWRPADRRLTAPLVGYADDPDPVVRWHALYALGRLRDPKGASVLVGGLRDPDSRVRAAAARGITRALLDSAQVQWRSIADELRPLLSDTARAVRVNALRSLATFHDSSLAASVVPLVNDVDVNIAVQAETTLGVLGGSVAAATLAPRARSAVFALRRQALIGLAQTDSAAGVTAAAGLVADADWRWRAVAAETFGAARDRVRLEAQLADADGRVVAQALQALARVVPEADTSLTHRARTLLEHPDPAVRSVAADLLARRLAITDVDILVQAYNRAAGDPFNDARLSAVSALAAIARASADGRLHVATRFVGVVSRPDDYLVRRLAAERFPDAAAQWGPAAPIATGRTDADYRDVARRYLAPALAGQPPPRVTIETDRGTLIVELLADQAPLTVAAFLSLVERRYFDGFRWHRAVPNFVIQDGDPRGDGWGGPGFVLRDELNPTLYQTGTLGMALSGPDTGGSQFFITHSPQPHLDGTYTVFGRVVSGATVLAGIAQGDRIRSIHR